MKNILFRPKEADEPVGEYINEKEMFWKVHHDWKGMSVEETEILWKKEMDKREGKGS